MATQLQKLIQALRGGAQPAQPMPQQPMQPPQMGGMAGQGQGIIQARPAYLQYVEQVQSQGGQPVPFEQFMQGAR